ncbi:MAG TPA: hypothetical protein VL134_04205 [Leptolyngbya sp.]|nr:hypothetical protein [Leptolyngbya sp.]
MTQKTPPRSSVMSAQAPAIGHAPAVPISVYREVVAELQATKTAMESIKAQNQQLTRQNQQLRQEIEKAVQSALQLRKLSSTMSEAPAAPSIPLHLDLTLPEDDEPDEALQIPVMPPRISAPKAAPLPPRLAFPEEKLVIEQESKPRRKLKLEKESNFELKGWMLGVVIALIVVSAFGAGFLLVRPLLTPASK